MTNQYLSQGERMGPILQDLRSCERVGEYLGVDRNDPTFVWVFEAGVGHLTISMDGITICEDDFASWILEFAKKHDLPLNYVAGHNLYPSARLFIVRYEIKYQED